MGKSNSVGIGIVGCGDISGAYARSILTHPDDLKIVGVYDIVSNQAKEFVKQFGGYVFHNMEELLDSSQVELVVNLTTPNAHAKVTHQALEAGKHVYSEKPLATNRKEGLELIRIAKEANLLLGCSPFVILGEAQQTLWKVIREGMIGQVLEVTADVMHGRTESWHPNPIPFYSSGVGPMIDVGCYPLSVLTSILGPVSSVQGMAKIRIPERIIATGPQRGKKFTVATPDHITGLLEFANGVGGRITASFVVGKSACSGIEMHGTKGSLRITSATAFDSEIKFCAIGEKKWHKIPFISEPYHGIEWSRGLLDIGDAIRNSRPVRCTGTQANHILDISLGILESSKSGCRKHIKTTFEPPNPVWT